MPIKFRCPHCQQFLGISESKAGSIADCPTCGHSIRVPDRDGTVGALPAPRLNLEDEGLLSALGKLASLQDLESASPDQPDQNGHSLLPGPVPLHSSFIPTAPVVKEASSVLPVEVALYREAPLHPVAHVEDPDEPPTPPFEVLSQLIQQSGPTPISDTFAVSPAPALFSNRIWIGMTLAAFACGFLLGIALRSHSRPPLDPHGRASARRELPPASPPEHQPAQAGKKAVPQVPRQFSITGAVTYPDATGTPQPDRGSRILLLPLTRTGTTKLSGPALRVGADALDRNLLQAAAQSLGGAFQVADDQGRYELSLPAEGRYGLLIVSQHQGRPAGAPLTDHCRTFLANCFERPELALGDVAYTFSEVSLEADHPLVRDVAFQAR